MATENETETKNKLTKTEKQIAKRIGKQLAKRLPPALPPIIQRNSIPYGAIVACLCFLATLATVLIIALACLYSFALPPNRLAIAPQPFQGAILPTRETALPSVNQAATEQRLEMQAANADLRQRYIALFHSRFDSLEEKQAAKVELKSMLLCVASNQMMMKEIK